MLAITDSPKATQYVYYDRDLKIVWSTTVPKNDDDALNYFYVIERFGPSFHPVYLERDGYVLPYEYADETIWIQIPGEFLMPERREVETVTDRPFQVKPSPVKVVDMSWLI